MQGKKEYSEKLFINFRLSERVPKENFYRRLKELLDLSYLSKLTAKYYGTEGQKSIDLANKQVLMASAAYNLKKLMGFEAIKSAANVFKFTATDLKLTIFNKISQFYEFILFFLNHRKLKIYYC